LIFNITLWLTYLFIKLFSLTYRFKQLNQHYVDIAKNSHEKGGYLIAIWHQNAIAGILSQNKKPHSIIVSRSKDGEFVAYTCKKLGHIPVRGSSHRGGHAAMLEMISLLSNEGIPGAITVDGPKGPLKSIKPGIFQIAKQTNCMIVPYSTTPAKFWEFNSWDKFRLPKPFTTIIVSYGQPFSITDDLTDENIVKMQNYLANELDNCEEKAQLFLSK